MIELRDSLLRVRIVRWPFKLVYIVGAYALGAGIARLLGFTDLPLSTRQLFVTSFDFVSIAYAARIFRGRGEPLEPARPWWQLTARAKASRRIGGVAVALGLLLVADVILLGLLGDVGKSSAPAIVRDPATLGLILGEDFAIAVAYLHSARRLRAAFPLEVLPAPAPLAPPAIIVPALVVPAGVSTSRHAVVGMDTAVRDDALGGRRNLLGTLAVDRTNETLTVLISVRAIPVGRLTDADARRYRAALHHLPAPLAVQVLLTGDRLWVELPEPGDIAQLGIDVGVHGREPGPLDGAPPG